MRYSDTHKAETHTKILTIAGRMLREKGPDGLAVAEVMQSAGLTHGGFYAHFKSKDALMVEALEHVFTGSKYKFQTAVDGLPPAHALAAYIDFYVSARHRDNPSNGCPITALNSDMPRQSKKVRETFDAGAKALVNSLADRLEKSGVSHDGNVHGLAAAVLSAMAGAVAVSRAVSDKRLSDEMLDAARASIKQRLGLTDAALSRSKIQ